MWDKNKNHIQNKNYISFSLAIGDQTTNTALMNEYSLNVLTTSLSLKNIDYTEEQNKLYKVFLNNFLAKEQIFI